MERMAMSQQERDELDWLKRAKEVSHLRSLRIHCLQHRTANVCGISEVIVRQQLYARAEPTPLHAHYSDIDPVRRRSTHHTRNNHSARSSGGTMPLNRSSSVNSHTRRRSMSTVFAVGAGAIRVCNSLALAWNAATRRAFRATMLANFALLAAHLNTASHARHTCSSF
jgi:hypothetical protein